MAEGFLRHFAGNVFDVYSAGVKLRPVHPLTVEVMKEVGIDVSGQSSKGMDALAGLGSFLFVIIVCADAEANCPNNFEPAAMRIVWPLRDPAAVRGAHQRQVAAFRAVRDDIKCHVLSWLQKELPSEWFPQDRNWS
jgi:arsenate reductase